MGGSGCFLLGARGTTNIDFAFKLFVWTAWLIVLQTAVLNFDGHHKEDNGICCAPAGPESPHAISHCTTQFCDWHGWRFSCSQAGHWGLARASLQVNTSGASISPSRHCHHDAGKQECILAMPALWAMGQGGSHLLPELRSEVGFRPACHALARATAVACKSWLVAGAARNMGHAALASTAESTPFVSRASSTFIEGGKGKGKGLGKEKGKGKGKGAGGDGMPPPRTAAKAPAIAGLPAAPAPSAIAHPKALPPAPDAVVTEERKLLQALAPHLGQLETLPSHLRDQLSSLADLDHQQESKQLHNIVQRRAKAKAELVKLAKERAQFEASWAMYAQQLQDLLQKQYAQRTTALEEFAKAEVSWRATLQESAEALSKPAGEPGGTEVVADSDMETESVEKDAVTQTPPNLEAIRAGQRNLMAALQEVQASAQQHSKQKAPARHAEPKEVGMSPLPCPWPPRGGMELRQRSRSQQRLRRPRSLLASPELEPPGPGRGCLLG